MKSQLDSGHHEKTFDEEEKSVHDQWGSEVGESILQEQDFKWFLVYN